MSIVNNDFLSYFDIENFIEYFVEHFDIEHFKYKNVGGRRK